jgi:hypothetical protein
MGDVATLLFVHFNFMIQLWNMFLFLKSQSKKNNVQVSLFINSNDILVNLPLNDKGLGAIRAKIGSTSDVDKIFSKMYSQYVLDD